MWSAAAFPAFVAAAALALGLPTLAAGTFAKVGVASSNAQIAQRHLRTGADDFGGVVQPFRFKQQLLVCNAYPNDSPITVEKNGREVLAGDNDSLHFQECRYFSGQVQKRDQLDIGVRDLDIHSTFEVGELPSNDAVLLLVLGPRPSSSMVGFQSFAFPMAKQKEDAQVAVIDALQSGTGSAHLRMEDHITGMENQTVSKRVEQLNFNRIYSVQQGSYDASITNPQHEAGNNSAIDFELSTRKTFRLSGKTNYVVLRTGGGRFQESLVVFPPVGPVHSGAKQWGLAWAAVVPTLFILAIFA